MFAVHREVMETNRLDCELPDGANLETLYEELERLRPAMRELRSSTSFAVNREIVESYTPLRSGDEVALLAPVSGGCCD